MGLGPSREAKDDKYPPQPLMVSELLARPRDRPDQAVLKTGDIIMFSGNGWRAFGTRWVEWCDYSHVGMVHWVSLPGSVEQTCCVWESVGHLDDLSCVLHGRRKTGPRLVPLRDKLDGYIDGSSWHEVRICHIRLWPHPPQERAALEQALLDFENHLCAGSTYPSPTQLVLSAATWQLPMGMPLDAASSTSSSSSSSASSSTPSSLNPRLATYTCDQLIATTLVQMHAYSSELPVKQIHLASFLNGSILERYRDKAALDQINWHWIVKSDQSPPPRQHPIHYA